MFFNEDDATEVASDAQAPATDDTNTGVEEAPATDAPAAEETPAA